MSAAYSTIGPEPPAYQSSGAYFEVGTGTLRGRENRLEVGMFSHRCSLSMPRFPIAYCLIWLELVFASATRFRSPFTITEWHWEHTGAMDNEKLSRIHPLQFSFEQDQIGVISKGESSSGLFRE